MNRVNSVIGPRFSPNLGDMGADRARSDISGGEHAA
jgi:hypothetical protein